MSSSVKNLQMLAFYITDILEDSDENLHKCLIFTTEFKLLLYINYTAQFEEDNSHRMV